MEITPGKAPPILIEKYSYPLHVLRKYCAFSDSPHMGRSIWDMPAAAVAAPPTPNPALTREQQEHQLLHQQQQQLFMQQQQNEVEKINHGWDQVRTGLMDENQQHSQQEFQNQREQATWPTQSDDRSLGSQNSQLTGQEYNNSSPSSATVQPSPECENKPQRDSRNISTIDSFRTETPYDNDSNLNKNNFNICNNNSVSKIKDNKKERKEKVKKEGKKNEKISSNNNQQDTTDHYIPGMEGAVKPEVPITATKSMEEEQQQRAQADALYRLQVNKEYRILGTALV